MTGTWAQDTADTAPDPITFLSQTDGPIDLLENFCGIQFTPELTCALSEHAAAGRQIRILTNRPIGRVEPLLGDEHVEIRYCEYLEHSLLRAGDAMLLAHRLRARPATTPPPTAPDRPGRAVDRLLENLDTIAKGAEGPITSPEQLDR